MLPRPITYKPTAQQKNDRAGMEDILPGFLVKDNGAGAVISVITNDDTCSSLRLEGVVQGDGEGQYQVIQ